MTAEKEAKKQGQKGFDARMAALFIAALVLVGAGAYYFASQPAIGQGTKNELPKANPLESASAKLLLGSYDKESLLSDYYLNYTNVENGGATHYAIGKNGTDSWVRIAGDFGVMQGWFGKDNSTDTVCLTYGGAEKCAATGNDTEMQSIANSLRILRLNPSTSLEQKSHVAGLVSAGAITFAGDPVDDSVGQIGAQKLTYLLNYRNLTVQSLISIGVNPNDPAIYSITDWQVQTWVSKKNGLVVRSATTYKENLVPTSFDRTYSAAENSAASIPAKPTSSVSQSAFKKFYSDSKQDYAEKTACTDAPAAQKDSCYKNIAAGRGEFELCLPIKNESERSYCGIAVAQGRKNSTICGLLPLYRDDCYITVVGETGDYELCKNLKNQSLGPVCAQAATEGRKKAEAAQAAYEKKLAGQNCKTDADCRIAGNAGQYCVPNTSKGPFANQTQGPVACFMGVPCGCDDNYCGFRKNDTYYACVNEYENIEFQKFIDQLKAASNATAGNGTGAANTSK